MPATRFHSRWARRLELAVLGAVVAALAWESATRSVDFPIYHRVGHQILQGDYELYPAALYSGGPAPSHGFRYAPAIAFLFVPFALLPLEAAALVFFLLKTAAFVYVGSLVAGYLGVSSRARTLMLASLVCVGGYVVEEFRYGNFHFLSVMLMVVAFVKAEQGKVAVPAAALALAIATKLMPVMLLPYLALRRRAGVCAATIVALAFIAIVPSAIVGYQTNNHLLEGFGKYAVQKIDEGDNYSLRGVLFRYLTPDHRQDLSYPNTSLASLSASAVSALWVMALAAGGMLLARVLWREPSGPAVRALEFSLMLTAMLLASPHTQRRYFTALYVPILTLLALLPASPVVAQGWSARLGLVATGAASTFLPLLFGGRTHALAYEASSPYFFSTLVLFVVLLLTTERLKSRHPSTVEELDRSQVSLTAERGS
jgi:Glycosyltransferase family 87